MKHHRALLSLVVVTVLCIQTLPAQAADPQYKLLKEIPIGGDGGWDYLSIDSATSRLYVSHATKVVVVDLAKDAIIGEITDTPDWAKLIDWSFLPDDLKADQ